ncbi:MAG: Hsp20/alpha crystallin family protein [Gammaproteobacteria bacterium]|jgi:HSP20 family protein
MAKKADEKKGALSKTGSKSPFAEMEKRFHELERRFDDLFSGDWGMPSSWELPEWSRLSKMELKTPKVDIIDRDDDILVRADVPGVNKENLDVTLTDNTITIKGSTSEEKKEEKGDYFRSETMKGEFSRTMSLPSDVDGNKAATAFKDGVLEVTVPKVEKAKRIKVNVT